MSHESAHEAPLDRRFTWIAPAISVALAASSYIASRIVSSVPVLAEWWSTGPSAMITRPLSLFTGMLPFAVGEVVVIAYVVFVALQVTRTIRDVARSRRSPRNAAVGGARRVARDGGIIVTVFYALWGLNYARQPLESRLRWEEWAGADTAELARLSRQAVELVNQAYRQIHHTDDAGQPTGFGESWPRVESAIDRGWARTAALLHLDPMAGAGYGRIKRPVASGIIARFGIVGMYFPFTAEANALRGIPAVRFVAAAAHEKAHQRGVANESEASFLGYIAASLADDPLARYGAATFAENQLIGALAAADPDEFRRVVASRLPGVNRDLRDVVAYFNRYRGVGVSVGRAVNDRYLRANRVPGGVRNYGRSVRLLITFARTNGGSIVPETPDERAR